ncbi:alpha/beta fold hydrolase [Pseudonocardia broussonetiae]|nr:alpha/beta fold hydrolase [Pseudonocardia broussonetiae]
MVDADPPPFLVLVHGFLDDAAIWQPVLDELGASGKEAVAVDLAGMSGRPDEPGPYTLDRYVDDVTAAVDATTGPLVLVGQSMGAQIAELVAAARPDRVAGLALLAPVPLAGTHLPEEAVAPFKGLGGSADAQRCARQQLSASFPPAELDRLSTAGARIAVDAVPQFVDAWNTGDPAGTGPSAFTGPVLVLRGAADPFCTAEVVEAGVLSRFPGARTAAVEDAGHWVHAEQPRAVGEHLASLLAEMGAPAGNRAAGVERQGWTTAFEEKTPTAFGQAFAPTVQLQAGTLHRPVVGPEAVQQVMAAASGIYESLTFTHQAGAGVRTYLEWEATAFGGTRLQGVTVLTKDDEGRIVDVAIHHRPLAAALAFSRELGERLAGTIDRDHFHQG